jgi:hypothetical protein
MSEPKHTPNRRRAMRKRPKGRMRIQCYRGTYDLGRNLAVALKDLSEIGAQLIVKTELPIGQEIFLCLEASHHVRTVKLPAIAAWCHPEGEGTFRVGADFQKRMEYIDLLHLT